MKIKDRKQNENISSYERIFDNKELGVLISKIHATSISNGTELERLILRLVLKSKKIICLSAKEAKAILDDESNINHKKIYLISKKNLKGLNLVRNNEPDFLVIKSKTIYIIELKDGTVFDTKKAQGEIEHLKKFAEIIAPQIVFKVKWFISTFNHDDLKEIKKGFKGKINDENIMAGSEFCKLLEIDRDQIINERKKDARENIKKEDEELKKIEEIQELLFDKE